MKNKNYKNNKELQTLHNTAQEISANNGQAEYESVELLKKILNAPNVGIGLFRAIRNNNNEIIDFVTEFANERTLQAFGNIDPIGRTLSSFGSDGIEQMEYFKAALEKGEKNSYTRKAESGIVEGWFLFSNARIDNDRVVQVWEDITEIKKAGIEILSLQEKVTRSTEEKDRSVKAEEQLARELEDSKKLQHISNRLIEKDHVQSLYEAILDSAMELMHADLASIQSFIPEKNQLYLLAHKNFHPESAKYWEYVQADSTSCCGYALSSGARIMVKDVEHCDMPVSEGDQKAYRASGIVSVQTTVLFSRSGKLVGMLSTQWKKVYQPSERDLRLFDVLARQAADIIERSQIDESLKKSQEDYRLKLESEVAERTAALKKSKQLIKATMNAAMDMIQVFEAVRNDAGEIVDFRWILNNHASENYYGDVIGKSLLTLNPGVIKEGIFETFKQVVETGIPDQRERYYVHEQFNGWFYQSVVKLGDGVATTTTDITKRKRAEQEARENRKLIDEVNLTIPDLITISDVKDNKVVYASQSDFWTGLFNANEIYHKPESERVNMMIHEDSVAEAQRYLKDRLMLSENEICETELKLKQGKWIRIRSKIFKRDEQGKPAQIISFLTNITAKKEAEDEIKRQSNYIQRITQTIPDMISVMELSTGKVEYINSAVFDAEHFDHERMKRTPRAELRKLIHEDDHKKLEQYYEAFSNIGDDDTVTLDYRARNDQGFWHWYRVRGKVFQRDVSGKVSHIINVIENITKEKDAEEKINHLNNILTIKNRELESANAEIKTFNSIAATDYKETLRQLYTSLEYIITHEARHLSDPGKANIRRAQAGIQKMKLLTEDIVGFSKIQTLDNNLADADLDKIIKNEIATLKERMEDRDVTIQCDELPAIKGYPLLLSLLFHHLLDNAVKFRSKDRPTLIRIECKKNQVPSVSELAPGKTYIMVSVTDNGIGFEQTEAEKIFTMFYRLYDKSKYKGSGVGLAICKKVMDIHHGYITAESVTDKGSSFHCYFPEN